MKFIGRNDAWALAGVGAGIAASSPILAGSTAALALLAGPAMGAGYLTWAKLKPKLSKVNIAVREGFTLPSDEVFPESIGMGGLRMGFTRDKNLPVDIPNENLMRHTAIIGQSGVGKTTLGEYILWQQMARGGGWIFVDAKLDADTRDKLAYMARSMGREMDFYVLNVDQPENSHTYNPLLKGDADEVASRLLNLLPSSENNPGSDFYRQSANQALTVIIGALKVAKMRYHFGDLAIMLQSGAALSQLERITPPGKERMALLVFLDQYKKRTKEGMSLDTDKIKTVLGGMSGRIAMFAQGKFGQVCNTYNPEIDLTEIIMGNKFLYVMLPSMGKDVAALNLGKMIMSDIRTAVYNVQAVTKALRPWPPYIVFADEMGSYVMPGIARLFEQARSAHICMIPAFQSFANLAVVSPEFSDIIIQNTWNKVFFKFGSQDSPETAAEILGKEMKDMYSVSASTSEGQSSQALRATPQGNESESGGLGESWREMEGYRVSPDQLRSLSMGQAIIQSGARMFHINTPMLKFPPQIPVFKAIRHPTRIPKEETVLDFESRFKEFLTDVGSDNKKDEEVKPVVLSSTTPATSDTPAVQPDDPFNESPDTTSDK